MKFLRDRKVRDVLWQALATVGLVVVVVFFVWLCAKIGDNRPADGQMN